MTDAPNLVEELDPDALPEAPPDFDPCETDDAAPAMFGLLGPTQEPATWLEAAFKKWGVPYRVVTGWQDRGRPPSSGGFHPRGVLNHHTGATSSATNPHPSLGILVKGRSDLTGPLCQVSTDYNGVTTIVAAGRANHAGKARAAAGVPAGDGNELWIGNEIETNGTQPMPRQQYAAAVLVNAAILDHLGETAVALHATTSYAGKWDLGAGTGQSGVPYSVTRFRADVAARLAAGPPTTQEDEVTPENIKEIADAILSAKVVDASKIPFGGKLDPELKITLPEAASYAMRWSLEGRDAGKLAAQLAEAAALKGDSLTPGEVDDIATAVGEKLAAGFDVEFVPKAEGGTA